MAVYAISFRIKQELDHEARRKSLQDRIEAVSIGHTWDETTSFYIIECGLSTAALANTLYYDTELLPRDHLLVINLSAKSHATHGEVKMPNVLAHLMAQR